MRDTKDDVFVDVFTKKSNEINNVAIQHGFWLSDNGGEKIALMHSELSEALEALRNNNPPDEHCPGFSSLEIELADCVIRVMDFSVQENLRLAEAIVAKTDFNKKRPYQHGKRF